MKRYAPQPEDRPVPRDGDRRGNSVSMGVHISASAVGSRHLQEKTSAERKEDPEERIHSYGLEVSALIVGQPGGLEAEEGSGKNIAWGKKPNEVAVDMANGLWIAHMRHRPQDPAIRASSASMHSRQDRRLPPSASVPPSRLKQVREPAPQRGAPANGEINSPGHKREFRPSKLLLYWLPKSPSGTISRSTMSGAMSEFNPSRACAP